MHAAIIGLGEAGSRYAAALVAAGHTVAAFDPRDVAAPAGVALAGSEADAVAGADLVLVLTSAAVSRRVAEASAGSLEPGATYADMTSSAPGAMEELARDVERSGARFADVAILGPVTVAGAATPLLVSGSGADAAAAVLRGLGARVDTLEAPAGAAMAHKLLRSVFMKGLASLVLEAVSAGEAAGAGQWIRREIARQLAGDGQATIARFLAGTPLHAERRAFEMEGAGDYLASLGVPAEMTSATIASLKRTAAERPAGNPTDRSVGDASELAQDQAKAR